MTVQAIFADRVFTPHDEIADAVLLIDDHKITAIGSREQVPIPATARRLNARGLTIVPGFVDVHIHGAGGRDVMESSSEALEAITRCVASRGTTSLVATTVTASEDTTCRAVSAIADWMRCQHKPPQPPHAHVPQAEILGIHFEGPFISPVRRGVHPPQWITPPSVSAFRRFLDAAQGSGRIITLAPELPGALDLVSVARAEGVVVSLGHTDASYAESIAAIDRGAAHAAHVFNAMRPFAHRECGVIGAVLTSSSVTCELIADGIHVDPAAIRLLVAAKGPRNVVLVSDGTAATGMPDGVYRLGTFSMNVVNGVPRDSNGKLAGSTLTLDRALRVMVSLGVPIADALAMVTANPARVIGLSNRKGAIVAGADADLVLLDSRLEVAGVMTRGEGWPKD